MLKLYREKHQGRFPGSISTFGFGYSVKSILLRDIAEVGGGMYAFIPDSGFVGTAFVNALANQLATMGTQAVLSVELPPELQNSLQNEDCILGQASCMVTSWGASIDLSTLKYGQSKDVVIRLALPDGVSAEDVLQTADFLANLSYTPLPVQGDAMCILDCQELNITSFSIVLGNSNQTNATTNQDVVSTSSLTAPSAESNSYISVQSFRSETIVVIADLMQQKLTAPEAPVSTASLTALISDMRQWLKDHPKNRASAYTTLHFELVEGLMKDLSGQVTEAIQGEYFKKWGRHFLPSLARSHQLQECLNFKDPGVQLYGGNLFQSQRDFADDAFNTLPPPTPSVSRTMPAYSNQGRGAGASRNPRSSSRPVSMSCFNSASAPCFHGDCLVHMEDGSLKPVADIRRGDRVSCNVHQQFNSKTTNQSAEVECVVETQTKTGHLDLVHFEDGLQVTPYHPIFGVQQTGDVSASLPSWHFPVDSSVGKMHETECCAVYSFVLRAAVASTECDKNNDVSGERAQSMLINNMPCITLAHGIQSDDVASHAFYGTERVLKGLRDIDAKGFDSTGHVVLQEGCVRKDPETGLACGFRGTHNPASE